MSYQYSVGVQQELARRSVLSVSYVGNQNRHQNDYRETNLPQPRASLPALIQGTVAYNTRGSVSRLPLHQDVGERHELALQRSAGQLPRAGFENDLTLQAAYTFSKAIDPVDQGGNAQDLQNVSNPYDRAYDNGPSPLGPQAHRAGELHLPVAVSSAARTPASS